MPDAPIESILPSSMARGATGPGVVACKPSALHPKCKRPMQSDDPKNVCFRCMAMERPLDDCIMMQDGGYINGHAAPIKNVGTGARGGARNVLPICTSFEGHTFENVAAKTKMTQEAAKLRKNALQRVKDRNKRMKGDAQDSEK